MAYEDKASIGESGGTRIHVAYDFYYDIAKGYHQKAKGILKRKMELEDVLQTLLRKKRYVLQRFTIPGRQKECIGYLKKMCGSDKIECSAKRNTQEDYVITYKVWL